MLTPTEKNGRHAEIAGAGFAGLTAATALARLGWTVRVHESNSELRGCDDPASNSCSRATSNPPHSWRRPTAA